jgi:hypothetical protein
MIRLRISRVYVFVCSVAVELHATLRETTAGNTELVEDNIIAADKQTTEVKEKAKSMVLALINDQALREEFTNLSEELAGVVEAFKKFKSILCYFICSSEQQIRQLHRLYDSGHLQTFLESIFTLLVKSSDRILIEQLTWNSDNYEESIVRLSELKKLGMCIPDRINLFCLSYLFYFIAFQRCRGIFVLVK